MDKGIRTDLEGAVAIVTINRPHRRNALHGPAWTEIRDTFGRLGSDRKIRAIVLTGAEGHFCAGDDLKESQLKLGGKAAEDYARTIEESYLAITSTPQPVFAAVSGACLGGGLSLALHCDFRVADASAIFGVPSARIGDYYPAGLCHRLAITAGLQGARRLLMSGDPVQAEIAAQWRLVDEIAASAQTQALNLAADMADKAPLAVNAFKVIANAIADGTYENRKSEFDARMETIKLSSDRQEGRNAFIEKRPPRFIGN